MFYRTRISRREWTVPRRAPPFQLEGCGPTFGFSNGLGVDRAWGETQGVRDPQGALWNESTRLVSLSSLSLFNLQLTCWGHVYLRRHRRQCSIMPLPLGARPTSNSPDFDDDIQRPRTWVGALWIKVLVSYTCSLAIPWCFSNVLPARRQARPKAPVDVDATLLHLHHRQCDWYPHTPRHHPPRPPSPMTQLHPQPLIWLPPVSILLELLHYPHPHWHDLQPNYLYKMWPCPTSIVATRRHWYQRTPWMPLTVPYVPHQILLTTQAVTAAAVHPLPSSSPPQLHLPPSIRVPWPHHLHLCRYHPGRSTTSFTAVDAAPPLAHPTSLITDDAAFEAVNMPPFHRCQYCPETPPPLATWLQQPHYRYCCWCDSHSRHSQRWGGGPALPPLSSVRLTPT